MIFEHRRSLKKARFYRLIGLLFFLPLFLGVAAYFVFAQEKVPIVLFGKFMFLVSALTAPFMAWNLVRLSLGTGEWEIKITQHEVIWQPPKNVGEKSLNLPISEISKIICESSKNTDAGDYYYIEMVSGEKHPLNPSASGINLNKFLNHLENLGVKYEAR